MNLTWWGLVLALAVASVGAGIGYWIEAAPHTVLIGAGIGGALGWAAAADTVEGKFAPRGRT